MNKKTYKRIKNWLAKGHFNREWEALLAIQGIQKWKYNTFKLQDIEAFVIIRSNNHYTQEELETN